MPIPKMPVARLMVSVTLLVVATAETARTYGDTVIRQVLHRHPGIEEIEVTATSTKGRPMHFHTVRHRASMHATSTTLPLANALGEPIGLVSMKLRTGSSAEAPLIAVDLSHHIYAADMLAEPEPFVDGAVTIPRAQALVEDAIVRHATLVTLAMHVAMRGAPNRIIASNFGRIGKRADADDVHVIVDGAVLRELTNGGRRLAIELPLRDRRGRAIGALSTSFLIGVDANANAEAAYAEAMAVRDELAHGIPSLAALDRKQRLAK